MVFVGAVTALVIAALFGIQNAYAAITSSLQFGDSGQQVTELQTFLATDSSIYPSGLITGYFGSLTQAAVQQFQAKQGIVSSGSPDTTGYGRVGPQTRARINALSGSGSNVTWDTVPVLSTPAVQVTNTSATVTFFTNENTQGQVYWSPSPIQSDEATGPHQTPFISGMLALDAAGSVTNHNVVVSGLQPNTLYYFVVRVIDSGGNITMTLPATFRTNSF